MDIDFGTFLPDDISHYSGLGFVRIVTGVVLVLIVARSVIHLFASDGGARRIAGVDTSVEGGDNIVAMFHQWGAVQLSLVVVLGVLFIRYPGLTPLVVASLALDPLTRALASRMKKLSSTRTPPGARLNWPMFVVLAVVFVCSMAK